MHLVPPPAPMGQYVNVDGRTYYITETGMGKPVFFLHGGGPGCSGWIDFGLVIREFARNHRCILIDMLQYGLSDKMPVEGPRWSFHAASLRALMDQLGIVRADFVCNSWGGSAALSLASKYPSRVRSVVVTGSMPIIHDALAPIPVRGQVGRMVRELYYGGEGPTYEKMRELIGRYEWYDASLVPDEVVRLRYEQSITPDERHLAAQPDSYRGTAEDLGACMRNIICPVLLLWGLHDAFVPPEYALMLTRLLSRAQLHILDAAGHHPQKERPLHYIEIVKSFLNQPETIQ